RLCRGWDLNEGDVGERLPHVGRHEGAGPLCGSARCNCARDFKCPPSPPAWRDKRPILNDQAMPRQPHQQAMALVAVIRCRFATSSERRESSASLSPDLKEKSRDATPYFGDRKSVV